MKKAILILVVGLSLFACNPMSSPINNYPKAIVCDRIMSKWGRALMIKYVDPKTGVWVYKKIWVTAYEYNAAVAGQPYTKS